MVASTFIILVSAALMIYWFRYTCLLMLRARAGKGDATAFAAANGLSFGGVREDVVRGASGPQLAALERDLARDYRLLRYLLVHTGGRKFGGLTFEQRVLMLDFRLMQAVYLLAGKLSARRARAAMLEMAELLSRLANDMGARAHAASRA